MFWFVRWFKFLKKLRWIFHLMLAYIDNLLGVLSLFYWFVQLLRNSAELPRQKSRQSSPLPFVLHFFLLLFFCTARVSEDCNFPIVLSFFLILIWNVFDFSTSFREQNCPYNSQKSYMFMCMVCISSFI